MPLAAGIELQRAWMDGYQVVDTSGEVMDSLGARVASLPQAGQRAGWAVSLSFSDTERGPSWGGNPPDQAIIVDPDRIPQPSDASAQTYRLAASSSLHPPTRGLASPYVWAQASLHGIHAHGPASEDPAHPATDAWTALVGGAAGVGLSASIPAGPVALSPFVELGRGLSSSGQIEWIGIFHAEPPTLHCGLLAHF